MTDLEMTKLCAEAMGYTFKELPNGRWLASGVYPNTYDPLHDDAQAMALDGVLLKCGYYTIAATGFWFYLRLNEDEHRLSYRWLTDMTKEENRRRARCECVAKIQAEKAAA